MRVAQLPLTRARAMARSPRDSGRRRRTPAFEPLETRVVPSTYQLLNPSPVPPLDPGSRPQTVASGVFSADRTFLAVADQGSHNDGRVSVFLSDGHGQFSRHDPPPLLGGAMPEGIVVGRFTSSGFDDIAVADNNSNVFIFRANGDGTFQSPVPLRGIPSFSDPTYLAAATIDGSSYLFVSCFDKNLVLVYRLNPSTGELQVRQRIRDISSPNQIVVANLNGDGNADLAVADKLTNYVTVLRGRRNGTFGPASRVRLTRGSAKLQSIGLAAVDMDNDKATDLAVTYSGAIGLLKNVSHPGGPIRFRRMSSIPLPDESPINVVPVDLGGLPGLAVTGSNTAKVYFLRNQGNFAFEIAQAISVGGRPIGLSAANLSGQETPPDLDLVVANEASDSLNILQFTP